MKTLSFTALLCILGTIAVQGAQAVELNSNSKEIVGCTEMFDSNLQMNVKYKNDTYSIFS